MTRPAGHLDALTGIRGLAAWGVVLYHVRLSLTQLLPDGAIAAMGKGYLAVDLFFILSGFVIWYNYASRIGDGGWAETGRFLWRRLARIWPLHVTLLGCFGGLVLAFTLTGRSTAGYPLSELPLHIALIQNWGLTNALSWNHPAWSISTESAAYLVMPALVAALSRLKGKTVPLIATALFLMALVYALFAMNGLQSLGGDIVHLGLWRCLLEFALGNVLCMLWEQWRDKRGAAHFAYAAMVALCVAGAVTEAPEIALAPAIFFTGLLGLALDRGLVSRFLGSRVVKYLGEISYSTYLAHFFLFIVFKLLFVDNSLQIGWAGLAGYLLLVLAASVLLYHFVEKPAQRWLNRHEPAILMGKLRPAK